MNPLNKMPVNSSNAGRSVPNYHVVPKVHWSILNESEKSTDYNQTASQKLVTHGPASKMMKHVDEIEHSLYRKKLKKDARLKAPYLPQKSALRLLQIVTQVWMI